MLDPQLIRKDPQQVAEACAKRGLVFDAAAYVELDRQRKQVQEKVQQLQEQRSKGADAIGRMVKQGGDASALKQEMQQVQQQLKPAKQELDELLAKLNEIHLGLPNILDDDVPVGKDESDNKLVLEWGEKPSWPPQSGAGAPADSGGKAEQREKTDSVKDSASESERRAQQDSAKQDAAAVGAKPKEHFELCPELLDFTAAGAMAGSRFALLRGRLAQLHRALAQMMLDLHIREHGYEEVNIPVLLNRGALTNSGQLPKFEDDLFRIKDDGYYLSPTAEVGLVNLAADKILRAEELPLKFTAHSLCFRSEAGSYGRDVKGMLRQHQFEKVELVQITKPQDSEAALEEMSQQAQKVLQLLKLPYRVVVLCSGDIGFGAAKTYDLEVWLPGQQAYREISSCSNCRDFQARRMQARWLPHPGKKDKQFVHTLNGSALAVGRTLIAVLENYQTGDGQVAVPEALRPYLPGDFPEFV